MNRRNILMMTAALFTALNACIEVNDSIDNSSKPVIDKMTAVPASVIISDTSVITVQARDLNGERLSYVWSKPDGGDWVGNVTGSSVTWKAPSSLSGGVSSKNFRIIARVQNENKKYALDTVMVTVNSTQNPVVTILSPLNGAFIPLSEGTVRIHAQSSFTDTYSMKCYINGVPKDSSATYVYEKNWNIAAETEGTKQIQIVATRPGGYTGTASVTISLEGTIGKRK